MSKIAVNTLANRVRSKEASVEALIDLVGPNGANKSYHTPDNVGAYSRSVGDKLSENVSVEDFGAIGDGVYHPLSEKFTTLSDAQEHYAGVPVTALTQSIDWAATYSAVLSGAYEISAKGIYILTDSVKINRSVKFIGCAYQNDVNLEWKLTSAAFVAYGTGAKVYTALGCTDGRNNGGTFTVNPSQRFTLDSRYELANYYNEDATPKLFSALFYIGYGVSGVIFEDVTVVKNFNGMDGYKNKTKGWGDNWDVGVYMDNARYCTFRNVNIIGYWLLNGLLLRSGSLDTESNVAGVYSGGEENKFYNCVFQGWKSVGLRSVDMYKALAVTPTYVEIPWSASHPFKNHLRLRSQEFTGDFCTLSSAVQVGDRLRLYTVGDMTSKYTVGMVMAPAYFGNGVAGTVFQHCRMHGMWHTSGYSVSDTWHDTPMRPSACVEISGTRIRGMRFEGCKAQTTDDIAYHAHQTIDLMLLPNARFEGSTDARGLGGVRMLSTNIGYAYYIRETYRVQIQSEQGAADFRPYPSEVPSKFASEVAANFWNPTLFGVYAEHGIFVGDRKDSNKLELFYQGGYTVPLSASDGDFGATGVVREGAVNRVGNMTTVSFSYYASNPTFTTGNGQIQTTIPFIPTITTSHHFPIMVAGNALGNKNTFAQIENGTNVVKFYYWGSAINGLQPLLVKDVTTNGLPIRVSGSFSYRSNV